MYLVCILLKDLNTFWSGGHDDGKCKAVLDTKGVGYEFSTKP